MFKTKFFLKIFDLKEIKSKKFFRGGAKVCLLLPPLAYIPADAHAYGREVLMMMMFYIVWTCVLL